MFNIIEKIFYLLIVMLMFTIGLLTMADLNKDYRKAAPKRRNKKKLR